MTSFTGANSFLGGTRQDEKRATFLLVRGAQEITTGLVLLTFSNRGDGTAVGVLLGCVGLEGVVEG